jgi:hypothetical protein
VLPPQLDGLFWLLVSLGPLIFITRRLHHEIQAVLLILTRRADLAVALFAVFFFPGVLLHEGSHYLTARVLGVRTGRFSILPRALPDGRLQLGFVETAQVDWLRDALIGAAPLVTGGLFVGFAGIYLLDLLSLWQAMQQGGLAALWPAISLVLLHPDFWLWFYLIFAVSSTMLPSASDRRAWLPLALVAGFLLGLSVLAGAGDWLVINLAAPLNAFLKSAAAVFFISFFIHILLFLPFFLFHRLLSSLTGVRVR